MGVWGFAPSGVQGEPLFRGLLATEVESILAFRLAKEGANYLSTFYLVICKLFAYHRSTALIRVLMYTVMFYVLCTF